MNAPERENILGHFFLNYRQILIDEIALEGLEGITLNLLWRRVALRISTPITEKMKVRFWKTILESKDICVYQLPEPLPHYELRDRFTVVDRDTGDLHDPISYLDGPYEYCPVPNEYGSCKYFSTRHLIPSQQLLDAPYEKIELGFGNTIVLVASIEKRWQALASHVPVTHLQALMPIQYCLLELIGKSRENGQMTTGTTNLTNIVKEPKNLFYHRKCLKNLDLVKVVCITQSMAGRGIKSLLLRLNRFHRPKVLSIPKVGKIHKVIEYLKECPNYSAKADILLSMSLFTQPQTKKIRKNNNIFEFFEQEDDGEPSSKKKKLNPKKRKCISIVTNSDESSQSDEEPAEQPIECRFKIGVGLMRQAYELFLEAGLRGLSQIELGQALGIEFYTTRMLCKCLKTKKLVRKYFEDKGKQRISRYVAVAAGVCDTNYAEERNKFLENIQSNNNSFQLDDEMGETAGASELIIPDVVPEISCDMAPDSLKEYESTHITELIVSNDEKMNIKSLIESDKSLTLRQLKFGNGVIKIVNDRRCVTGLQTLSNLVGKEINEPPMVSKALKEFLKKLVAAGQVKLYKVRWPGRGNELNYMNLICAPHIKITDPIVKAKYKEVHLRAMAKRKVPLKHDTSEGSSRPLSMFVNPRYMKIQKLHEVITKLTYFEPLPYRIINRPGFLSVTDLLPEMTVKFAISNMSTTGMAEISHLKLQDHHFGMKLKEAPPEISHGIMKCKSLRNALRMNLKALGMYGLIQLIYQPEMQSEDYFNSALTAFLFYVNRNASIIKTNGTWPRDCNIRSLEKKYYFETFEDVKRYWRDVYDFSIETTIVLQEPRARKTLNPPIRREHEVQLYDNGVRYGDGKGPCGLDSCFYLEIARLWRTYYVREAKPTPPPKIKKPVVKVPNLAKSKKKAVPKKKPLPKVVNPVLKVKTVTRGRKKLPEATITWTKQEDHIIVMCLVAMAITSPSSQPGSLRVRNVAAKDILTLKDGKKTQSICHRRVLMLQLNPALMHEKDSLFNEMKRRRHLIYKYEGLIKKLRVRYSTNMTKYMNEARIPMLELIWLIWKVSTSESFNRRVPCVAINVDNFYENFTITPNTANKMYNIYKSPDLAMLREAVFLSIILTYNNEIKSETAKKIHSIFKKYPESNLRMVVEQLRRSGAVSAKEKLFNNQMHRLHLEDIASSAYKVSAHYLRRWLGRLNSEFATSLSKIIFCELPVNNIKGSAEYNCVLCELQALGYLEIKTAVKPAVVVPLGTDQMNVIDIEMKHKFNSGSVMWEKKPNGDVPWTSNTVSSLYQDLEYESILDTIQKSAVACSEADIKHEYDMNDVIVRHLDEKGDRGFTFKELQEVTKYSSHDLVERLNQLEAENIVKRVGLQENVIILLKYIKNWTLKVDKHYIIITPWLNMNFEIRYDILLEWCSAIVNKVFEYPGSSIAYLSDSFEMITCRALQDACMFLKHAKCITMDVVKCESPDLFSDEDIEPVSSEFNIYEATENILVYPVKNCISRYTYLRKLLLDKHSNK